MARPKLSEDEKRQLHSFRLDPADRKAVQEAADAEGISFPAAAEKYIKAGLALYRHPAMDERTAQVIVEILDQLSALQKRNNGHRWWKTVKAWAAANEVFKAGPFARLNPDNWNNDEKVQRAWKAVMEAKEAKREAVNILNRMGVRVALDASRVKNNSLLGMFGRKINSREAERQQIEAMSDPEARASASAIFRVVEASDAEEEAALDLWRHEIEPFLKAEMEGVEIYKEYRREIVREQIARGETPHYEDFV